MPITGHAFVGVALASAVEPKGSAVQPQTTPVSPIAWMCICLLLAYVPDLAEQSLAATGWSESQAFSHSLPFAVVATILLAFLLSATLRMDRVRTGLIVGFSVIGHDLLDVMHYDDRQLLWPFSLRRIGLAHLHALTIRQELLVYAPLFAVFVVWLIWKETRFDSRLFSKHSLHKRLASAAVLLLTSSLLLLMANRLRTRREEYLDEARDMLQAGKFQTALELAKKAEQWPFPVAVAPVECLRGEVYEGQGNAEMAEQSFVRAYRSDPGYFWAVADSADFYSSSIFPVEERRRRSAPYVSRLRSEFNDVAERREVLARLERRLELPAGSLSDIAVAKPGYSN